MSEFIKVITHARRFKSATKSLSVSQLKMISEKLESIIESRISEQEEVERQSKEKIEKIQKYREMIAADGIDLKELSVDGDQVKRKRAPRPAKYAITNDAGEKITWTGQGRMPNVFKAQIDAGKKMDDFLI